MKRRRTNVRLLLELIILALILIVAILGYNIHTMCGKIEMLEKEVSQTEISSLDKDVKIRKMNKRIDELRDELDSSIQKVKELESENLKLKNDLRDAQNKVSLKSKEKSVVASRGGYNRTTDRTKYDQVVASTNYEKFMGGRSEITHDDIQWMKSLEEQTGVPHLLVLGIIMNESSGYSKAKNPTSSASGIGQFLSGSGKWTWETLMGRTEPYDHKVTPFDKKNGVEMMFAYLKWAKSVNKTYNGVVHTYRGEDDAPYWSRLEKWMGMGILELPW